MMPAALHPCSASFVLSARMQVWTPAHKNIADRLYLSLPDFFFFFFFFTMKGLKKYHYMMTTAGLVRLKYC